MRAYFEPVNEVLPVIEETTERELIASMAMSMKRIADSLEFFQNLAHHALVVAGEDEPDAIAILKRVYGEG